MTTLKNKQSVFLADYTIMLVETEVNDKLKALRETDEWENAIKEAKKDEKILAKVEKEKQRYENKNKLANLKIQIEEISDKLFKSSNYTLAYTYNSLYLSEQNRKLEVASIETFTKEQIQEKLDNFLNEEFSWYAKRKTGFVQRWSSGYWDSYKSTCQEIKARMSILNTGNFDELVEGVKSNIDTDAIVQSVVEHCKETPK